MDFWGDDRGASQVLGALFIFAFLVTAFTGYQLGVVPQQNTAAEWNHNLRVQDEMVGVRATIMNSQVSGEEGFTEVTLGTEYSARLIALNPPSPTGSLRTTEARSITVEDSSGDITEDACGLEDLDGEYHIVNETRMLEYRANYNEFDGDGVLRYENSVLYHSFDEANIIRSDQKLLRGNEVTIIPLVTPFSEQGSRAVTVEPRPGLLSVERVDGPTVSVPTALGQEDWETLLESELEERNELDGRQLEDVVTVENGVLTLDLERTYQVRCGAIGINETPESGDRDSFPAPGGSVHPAETAGIRFGGVSERNQPENQLTLDFENFADSELNISRFTVNFYTGDTDPEWAEISADDNFNEGETRVNISDPVTEVDPQIPLAGKDPDQDSKTTHVYIQFDDMSPGDWFIITIQYGTGERTQYFVGM